MSGPTEDDFESRVRTLAHRTGGVRPRADFEARVLAAVAQASPQRDARDVLGPAKAFLPASMLLAAVCLVWAIRVEANVDDAFVTTYGDPVAEVAW